MNPRETLLDSMVDEFAAEQSAPLDFTSSVTTSSSTFLGISTHYFTGGFLSGSSQHQSQHRSGHGNSGHGSTGGSSGGSAHGGSKHGATSRGTSQHGSSGSSNHGTGYSSHHQPLMVPMTVLQLTQSELDNLMLFTRRMTQVMKMYNAAHSNDHIHTHSTSTGNHTSAVSRSKRLATDDLRLCYREVPDIFFLPTFSLTNQDIFNEAMLGIYHVQHSLPSVNTADRDSSHSNNPLVELFLSCHEEQDYKLSKYLDLVEIALLRQIWSRSPAFFRALDDLKGLQYNVYDTIKHLKQLRNTMSHIDYEATNQALLIPKLAKRQRNEINVQQLASYMQQVVQGRQVILQLLEVEDYFSAQEVMTSVKKIYVEHLTGIKSLKAIGTQLMDMDNIINDVMVNKFISLGIQWEDCDEMMMMSGNGGSNNSGNISGNNSGNITNDEIDYLREIEMLTAEVTGGSSSNTLAKIAQIAQQQRQQVITLLTALISNNLVEHALTSYRSRLIDSIKLVVRTCVMEFLSTSDTNGLLSFADDPVQGSNGSGSNGSNNVEDVNQLDPLASVASAIASANSNGSNSDSHTTGSNSGSNSSSGSNIPYAAKVKEMSPDHFINCLTMCYEHVYLSVRKSQLFHDEIVRTLSSLVTEQSPSEHTPIPSIEADLDFLPSQASSSSNQDDDETGTLSSQLHGIVLDKATADSLSTFSRDCLNLAIEVSQKAISNLITSRKEINSKLDPIHMKLLWTNSLTFINNIEKCSTGINAFILMQCLLRQSRSFLDELHAKSKNALVNALDHERWIQCDVSIERQREIERLATGKAFLPNDQRHGHGYTGGTVNSTMSPGGGTTSNTTTTVPGSKEARPVIIDQHEYRVVWSVLLLIETVLIYLDISFHFPLITNEIINKLIDQVTIFNSRTKKLVLGAQAIQSAARLKSISAKHLALTGQSINLFIVLLPHIRAALLAQLPMNRHVLLTELDRLSQDLFEHHNEIVGKFVNIVNDVIEHSASVKLKLVDWDRFQAGNIGGNITGIAAMPSLTGGTPGSTPAPAGTSIYSNCEYFEDMQKNIITLHKVLSGILPNTQITDIFSRIFGMLSRKIPTHFEEIMPLTQTGKQRILDEIMYLVMTLSRLKHVDATYLTQLDDYFRRRYTVTSNVSSSSVGVNSTIPAAASSGTR